MSHAPQCRGSFPRLTQALPQGANPGSHAAPQAPAWQTVRPPSTAGQVFAQPPQLFGSVAVSTQALPHRVFSGAQVKSHEPETHRAIDPWGAVHVAPQPVQLKTSLRRLTHRPWQTVSPSWHEPPVSAAPASGGSPASGTSEP